MKKKTVIRLSILGESYVGKTCICCVYLGSEFNSGVLSTTGIDKLNSEITMSDGNEVAIKLRDPTGNERFRTMVLSIFSSSKGIILVFDLTDRRSFEQLDYWLEQIRSGSQDIQVVLFGNKCDLKEEREVSEEEA